ncbi:hypothetical protein M408DRAFT_210603 [Serendipita vermifera MAFF 305830]|uniref:Uncharacterized protein n=1 Tax=Serendipita vermifera MAFF 305830 TaxID=933852 RepID=A0A0C3B1J6_SERVB|nr:hypothetical protein M408DRAFT_210603 [Serendipita vermifera MAFF 305830]
MLQVASTRAFTISYFFCDEDGSCEPLAPFGSPEVVELLVGPYNDNRKDDMEEYISTAFRGDDNTADRRSALREFFTQGSACVAENLTPFYEEIGQGRNVRYRCRFWHPSGKVHSYTGAKHCARHMEDHLNFKQRCQGTETHPQCDAHFAFKSLLQHHYATVPRQVTTTANAVHIRPPAAIPPLLALPSGSTPAHSNLAATVTAASVHPLASTLALPSGSTPAHSNLAATVTAASVHPLASTLVLPSGSTPSHPPSSSTSAAPQPPSKMTSSTLELPVPAGETPLSPVPPTRFRSEESLRSYTNSCFTHIPNSSTLRQKLFLQMQEEKRPGINFIRLFITTKEDVDTGREVFECKFCDPSHSETKHYKTEQSTVDHIRMIHIQYYDYRCSGACGVKDCALVFPTSNHLNTHRSDGNQVECNKCGEKVRSRYLTEHQRKTTCKTKALKRAKGLSKA